MRRSAAILALAVDYPVAATIGTIAITLFLALFIPRVSIDTSADGFIVERDPARVLYDRFREQFGSDSMTLVVVKADDVFRPDVLGTVRRLTEQLEQVDGVVRVESLANARRITVDGDDFQTRSLLPSEIPSSPAALADIRQYALSHRVIAGNLVAANGRATAIIVYTDPGPGDATFNTRFVERVDALLASEERPGISMYEVGRPLLKHSYSEYIVRDLLYLIPLSGVVLLAVLLVFFRTAEAVIVPITTVAVSLVWVAGLMGLLGIPLNVVTAVIPPVLVMIGFAEDVHIITDYRARLARGVEQRTALRSAIQETAAPTLVTTLTTGIGFASLGFSDVGMLRQFGYGSALGLAGNYVVTMALLPPITLALARFSRSNDRPVERMWGQSVLLPFFEALGWFNVRHRVAILIGAAVVTLIALVGLSRIDVNTDFVSYFPKDAPIRARGLDAHQVLTGAEMFWIVVDTHRRDGAIEPEQLARIARLQQDLAATGLVDKTISVADYVMTINRQLHDGALARERVPDSREEVAQYLLLVPARDLSPLLTADSSAAAMLVRHNVSGSARLAELERRIDGLIASTFTADVTVNYTGETILTNNAADYMAVNELTSFGFTFAAIALIHSALFMSFKIGFLSLIPDLIPIVVIYGLMSFLGVPLNTGTALVATVAIGISVDDTVHHLMNYARQLEEYSIPSLAMFATLRHVGRAIITSSVALALGFAVMSRSIFVPIHQFGAFASVTMLLALVIELLVTPTLMMSVRVVTVWDLVQLKIDPRRLKAAPCFRDFSDWEVRKVVLLGMLRAYGPGDRVLERGEPGKLFVLVSGRLVMTGAHGVVPRPAWYVEPGGVAGEPGEPAGWSAELVAQESCEVLVLDFDSLEWLRRRFPYTAAKLFRNVATVHSRMVSTNFSVR